uniref:Uncharacterized protein n=1 Tax=Callithrix jacchus TaxID=9483 RepID=A0A8I3WJW3_CALJA
TTRGLQIAIKLHLSCAHHLGAALPPSPESPDSALREKTGARHAAADTFLAPSLAPRPFHPGVRTAAAPGGDAPSATKGRLGSHLPPHSPCRVFAPETALRRHLLVAPCRDVALGAGIRPGGARRPRSQKPQPGPAVPQRRAPPAPARAATRLSHPVLQVKSPLRAGHAGNSVSGDPARGSPVNGRRLSSSPLCTRPLRAHFSELRISSQLLKVADGKGKNMKKKHDGIVYQTKEILDPSPKVTNCCKSLRVKYSFQKAYMTQLVSSQPVPAMSRNPDHKLPSQPKEHSIGQKHHQEEIIHKLAMQLRHIGDSIDHRMVPEVRLHFPQPGPVRLEERVNKTMAAKYLRHPEIIEIHGLILSGLPNIRSKHCEPEFKAGIESHTCCSDCGLWTGSINITWLDVQCLRPQPTQSESESTFRSCFPGWSTMA